MRKDSITSIEINSEGQLHVETSKVSFPMIYRSATEIYWDQKKHTLYSPKPKEWTYSKRFKHIIDVIKKEALYELSLTSETKWINVPNNIIQEIEKMNH